MEIKSHINSEQGIENHNDGQPQHYFPPTKAHDYYYDQGQGLDKTSPSSFPYNNMHDHHKCQRRVDTSKAQQTREEEKEREVKGEYRIRTTSGDLPLMSTISYFIVQKKKEVKALHNIKKTITNDIDEVSKHKRRIETNLQETIEKEKEIMAYFSWYRELKQELLDIHGLEMDKEIEMFSRSIDDFKSYDYDASKILKVYKENKRLRQEYHAIQGTIDINTPLKNSLENQIASLNNQIAESRQSLNIAKGLKDMGFGLKELKLLRDTVIEISKANSIDDDNEAVRKFLKDIEQQYDDKLGFEAKVKEIKTEMKRLESQVPEYRYYLQLQGIIGPVLNHLHSNGVTNEDIISVNELITSFINNNYLSDPIIQDSKIKGIFTNKTTSRNDYWRMYLKKLRNLSQTLDEIEKHSSQLNNIKTEINTLSNKRQEIEKQCLDANHNLSFILSQTIYLTDMTRRINDGLCRKITDAPRFLPIFVIMTLRGGSDESNGSK